MQKKYDNYFKLSERQKQAVQGEVFDLCILFAIGQSDKRPKEFAWTIYEAAIAIGNIALENENFEFVQAIKDTIITYDLERSVDNYKL